MRNKFNSGQALLVVLLSLSVVLIIVLYIVSRSVVDVSLSTKDEESLRAFSAAEAGIERALVIGTDTGNLSVGDANFSADVSSFAEGETAVVYPIALRSGNSATFWFSRPDETDFTGSEMKVCWGDAGTSASSNTTPAIEVTVLYSNTPNDLSSVRIARVALDPFSSRASTTNQFAAATNSACTINGETFQFQSTISFSSLGISNSVYNSQEGLHFAKVKMLYNSTAAHKVGIDVTNSGSVLPSQGVKVDSQGSYGSANRRIEVFQLHPVPPSIFDNVVFSASGVAK